MFHYLFDFFIIPPHSLGVIWSVRKLTILQFNIVIILFNKSLNTISQFFWFSRTNINYSLHFILPHDSSDNVGYFVETADTNFCLMTDVGRVTDEMAEYIGRAHYLVIEANHDKEMLQQGSYPQFLKDRITSGSGHLNNELCGEAIAKNMGEHLRHVWLCHLSEENNHPELARKTVETVLRSYGIVAGKDFELEVLKRTKPTGIFELV